MTSEHRTHGHGSPEDRPHTAEAKPAPGLLSRDTDASAGRLIDVMILKQLKSLQNNTLDDALKQLAAIEKTLGEDRTTAVNATARILTAITNLKTLTEQHMATNEEILSRLDTRTTEIGATVTEMANDVIAVRDRLQALIDGQGDVEALRAGVEQIINDKLDPLAAQAAVVGADLDVMGRNPNDPFPTPTTFDPTNPQNVQQFATRSLRTARATNPAGSSPGREPNETEAQYRTRMGTSGGKRANETDDQFRSRQTMAPARRAGESDEAFVARTGASTANPSGQTRQPNETDADFRARTGR